LRYFPIGNRSLRSALKKYLGWDAHTLTVRLMKEIESKTEPACDSDLWVISVLGKDRPGIICDLLEAPAKMMVNIVDLDQRILQGIFVMSMVADFGKATATPKELESRLQKLATDLGVEVSVLPPEQYRGKRRGGKNLQVVTILARDRVGIIFDVASLAADREINIEKALVTARGELISIEFVMDFGAVDAERLREELKIEC